MLPWLPIGIFAAILLQGATLGLTDDEAYYWVLAQKPALGYAYHPPAVALAIALSQKLWGPFFGAASTVVVRFPAALSAASLVWLAQRWIQRAGGATDSGARSGALVALGFAGLFSLSWMMVPDWPLLVGWTVAFLATWELCFGERVGARHYAGLVAGIAVATLSKYSAVLGTASALVALWLWAPRDRRLRGTAALVGGSVLAAIPILVWNAQHEWASLLYQFRERHGGGELSLKRYAKFWGAELVLMGPPLFIYAARAARRALRARGRPADAARLAERYALLWAAPAAAVFFLQPLWADFKPHWAFIVAWPLFLAFGLARSRGGEERLARAQLAYGALLISAVWVACHLPLAGWARRGGAPDPRMDVTNDLYGWSGLRAHLERVGVAGLPVAGSRYQTASQAYFALGAGAGADTTPPATLLPRDIKAMDEWPSLGISLGEGPDWPKLSRAIVFVADNRYDGEPGYPGASCRRLPELAVTRYGMAAKTIYLWRCDPGP